VLAGGAEQAKRRRERLEGLPGRRIEVPAVLQPGGGVELPGVVEVERRPDDGELAERGPLETVLDGRGVADRRVDEPFDVRVVPGGLADRPGAVGCLGDYRPEERRRFRRRRLPQKVGGVLAERHRPLHPGLLVADGAQLLGEHELVEHQHERDAGGGGADQRLERRLDGVVRPERGPGAVDEEGGAHEPAEDEREHPRRHEPAVGVEQEPHREGASGRPFLHRVRRLFGHCLELSTRNQKRVASAHPAPPGRPSRVPSHRLTSDLVPETVSTALRYGGYGAPLRRRVLPAPGRCLGALLTAFAVEGLLTLPSAPEGEGFPEELAVLFLYAVGLVGFTTFATGLAIPPGDWVGITFRRRQRQLLAAGAGATLCALLVPVAAFGLLFAAAQGESQVPFYLWGLLHVLGGLSVAAALAWRGAEAVRSLTEGTP